MRRVLGWALGVGCALAVTATSAAAETRVSVGVFTPNIGVHVGVGRPVYREPVYAPPPVVYREPVYRERVYYPDPYRPVYRERVVVIERRHDNGRHKGWYKHNRGRDWRDERYERDHRR